MDAPVCTRRAWILLFMLPWVVSCFGGESGGGSRFDDPAGADTASAPDLVIPVDIPAPPPDGADGSAPDPDAIATVTSVDAPGDAPVDTGPPLDCTPGMAELGCPCDANEVCLGGVCVYHLGDRVCTHACEDESSCPAGWDCLAQVQTDISFVCVSRASHLCLPCRADADCEDVAGTPAVCLDFGEREGRFCGASCGEDGLCPAGYTCGVAQTLEGVEVQQCFPDAGACACSGTAIELGMSTDCHESSLWGTCAGIRACTPDGLGACTAATPFEEICFNQVDDDCDEEIDEDEDCRPCVCGDEDCEPDRCGEIWTPDEQTCAADCAICGDGVCDPGEGPVDCAVDCCGGCGDGLCKGGECGETPAGCPQDCDPYSCGDGTCDPDENPVDCYVDCQPYVCGNHSCEPTEDAQTCPSDCGPGCGDCVCEPTESYGTCIVDCGYCGDAHCVDKCAYLLAETVASCPADCECIPECWGKECGDDGCGGSCGDCPVGAACEGGGCRGMTDEPCDGPLDCLSQSCVGGACAERPYCLYDAFELSHQSCLNDYDCQDDIADPNEPMGCAQVEFDTFWTDYEAVCLEQASCGGSVYLPCCMPGQFCGRIADQDYQSTACCYPGELLDPQGLTKTYCKRSSSKPYRCRGDADCPTGWGLKRCKGASATAFGKCVECKVNSDCPAGEEHCSGNVCYECLSNSHCSGSTPYCDTDDNECVQCKKNSHCTGNHPICEEGSCVTR